MTGPTADQPQVRRDSGGEQVETPTPTGPEVGGPTGADDEDEETRTPHDGYRAL